MSFQTLKMLKLVTAHISCIQQPELSHGVCVCVIMQDKQNFIKLGGAKETKSMKLYC